MTRVEYGDFPFYQFQNLMSSTGVLHFVSSGAKNIGFSDDSPSQIIAGNRRSLAGCVGFDPGCWVSGHQVHSANVAVVASADSGRGALDKESRLPDTDALVTAEENVCLMVLSADCVPVLLYDPECRVVAAIHAGWKGTAADIAGETVKVMRETFGCRPEVILAGIGPSIGRCCFEVGEEVAGVFRGLFPPSAEIVRAGKKSGKHQVDLWEANRLDLLGAGLKTQHIEVAGMCTVCHPDHFFSYRRDGKQAGRFGAGIALRSAQRVKSEK